MGMATHELLDNFLDCVINSEGSGFRCDLTEKYHLKEEISKFILELSEFTSVKGILHLLSFFKKEGPE